MPTVKHVTAVPYDLPLRGALQWGKNHRLDALQHVLIFVELDDGAVGIGEATPRPSIYGETQDSVLAIVRDHLAPLVLGAPLNTLEDIDRLEHKTALIKGNNTARGALNIALHVALARSQGRGVGDLLGASQEQTTLSYILGTGPLDGVMQEVDDVVGRGIRCLKVKVGKDIEREFALIEALRSTYGDSLALYADANQCLTASNAAVVLERLAVCAVKYCEEPLPVHQIRARQALRRQTWMPIIGDDSCFTAADVERELDFATVDIVNIKTARTGFSQSRWIAAQARKANAGLMIGSQASSLLGCLHAILFACGDGIGHETEGSFYLKVDASTSLVIRDGAVNRADAENRLMDLERELLPAIMG